MNEEDRQAIGTIFEAKLSPVGERLARVETKMGAVEKKLEKVGNCGEHTIKMDALEEDVKRIDSRMHGATVTVLIGLLAILGSILVGVREAIASAVGKLFH